MNKLLRPPLPDELWSSTVARHAKLVGIGGHVTIHKALVGTRLSLGTALLPTQIGRMAARLDAGLSPAAIINRHTLLPYFVPFRGSKGKTAQRRMLGKGNVAFALGIASMKGYPKWLKVCPQCMAQDREAHGQAFWHRTHQPPGVIVCHRHKSPLCETDAPANAATQICRYVLPDECRIAPPAEIPEDAREDLVWIAEQSQLLLDEQLPAALPLALTAVYRAQLLRLGYMTAFDRLQQTKLIDDFRARFNLLCKMLRRKAPNANCRDNWLARILGNGNNANAPLDHLLVMRFLGLPLRDTINTATQCEEYKPKPSRSDCAMVRSRRISEELAQSKRAEWIELTNSSHGEALREKHDALYCWLWRNDRAWLKDQTKRAHEHRNSATAA